MKLRINRLISEAGLGSRREVEEYIRRGRVRINGRKAILTDMVGVEDTILLDDVDLPVKELIQEHMALEKVAKHEREKADKPRTQSKASERAESQRLLSSPKSAALRKTSKNNPENKWRHRREQEALLEAEAQQSLPPFRFRDTKRQTAAKPRPKATTSPTKRDRR